MQRNNGVPSLNGLSHLLLFRWLLSSIDVKGFNLNYPLLLLFCWPKARQRSSVSIFSSEKRERKSRENERELPLLAKRSSVIANNSPLANRGLVSGLRFLDSNEEQFHLLYANCCLQSCTAIWAPCNALATTSACVLQSSSCSLFKEGVFLQTVFKFSIGSTSSGRPDVKISYPESLTNRRGRVSLISSILYKYIGIWTTGVSNERKKTYLVSLDSTCTQSKMQADAILVRSDRCIVSRANGKFKGNVLIECSLRCLGACCRATYVCRVSEEDSCGWNNDPKVQQIWKSNFSSLLTDRQPREWHFKGSCWLLRRVLRVALAHRYVGNTSTIVHQSGNMASFGTHLDEWVRFPLMTDREWDTKLIALVQWTCGVKTVLSNRV